MRVLLPERLSLIGLHHLCTVSAPFFTVEPTLLTRHRTRLRGNAGCFRENRAGNREPPPFLVQKWCSSGSRRDATQRTKLDARHAHKFIATRKNSSVIFDGERSAEHKEVSERKETRERCEMNMRMRGSPVLTESQGNWPGVNQLRQFTSQQCFCFNGSGNSR